MVGACLVTLKDRDVILADAGDRRLRWWEQRAATTPHSRRSPRRCPGGSAGVVRPGVSAGLDRGIVCGRALPDGKTYLRPRTSPPFAEAQTAEFLAGPARSRGAVVDGPGGFNSAADGSTARSYALLTASFRDAWNPATLGTGLSCCQNETLTNGTSQAATRIDLVLGRHGVRPVTSRLVGGVPFRTTAAPLWASDHAGVVATLRLDG